MIKAFVMLFGSLEFCTSDDFKKTLLLDERTINESRGIGI